METKIHYSTHQGDDDFTQDCNLEAIRKFLRDRKFDIYAKPLEQPDPSKFKQLDYEEDIIIQNNLHPNPNVLVEPEVRDPKFEPSFELISPITDDEDEVESLPDFPKSIESPGQVYLTPSFNKSHDENNDFFSPLPWKNIMTPKQSTSALIYENKDHLECKVDQLTDHKTEDLVDPIYWMSEKFHDYKALKAVYPQDNVLEDNYTYKSEGLNNPQHRIFEKLHDHKTQREDDSREHVPKNISSFKSEGLIDHKHKSYKNLPHKTQRVDSLQDNTSRDISASNLKSPPLKRKNSTLKLSKETKHLKNPSQITSTLEKALNQKQDSTSSHHNHLTREDFRILKKWYDINYSYLSKLSNNNFKISKKYIELFMEMQNIPEKEAIYKIEQYISIRKKHNLPEDKIEEPKNFTKLTSSSNSSLPEQLKNKKARNNSTYTLFRLNKLTDHGIIKNKESIHNLIHEMTSCECQKTREACLNILLRTKEKPDYMDEFVKFGGVNLLSSWLENIAQKCTIDTQRNIVKMILDVLSLLNISNNLIRRSSIGKHVNFMVRSQLQPQSQYYCSDLNIVKQAQHLVTKWKVQFYGKVQYEPFQSDTSFNKISTQERLQKPQLSIEESSNPKSNQFLSGLLDSVKKQAEEQKQRNLDYQKARIEGEKKQWIAKQKMRGSLNN